MRSGGRRHTDYRRLRQRLPGNHGGTRRRDGWLLGIGLFGAITATIANLLNRDSYHGTDRSRAGELERLAALHSSGALTDDAFAAAKGRILSAEATCVARP
jgi:hypothetical protein